MKRELEPELMVDVAQAKAYADADFEVEHSKIVGLLDDVFKEIDISGEILDLGCGPGDVTFRLATKFSKAKITAIDGSVAMIRLAEERKEKYLEDKERINFIHALVPSCEIPEKTYELIVSTSFLHHLHDPDVLWETIKKHSRPGTKVFIADLTRPKDIDTARWIVNEFAMNEPKILKDDFYNSLLAAFTPDEVKEQINKTGLENLSVYVDRYVIVYGEFL